MWKEEDFFFLNLTFFILSVRCGGERSFNFFFQLVIPMSFLCSEHNMAAIRLHYSIYTATGLLYA